MAAIVGKTVNSLFAVLGQNGVVGQVMAAAAAALLLRLVAAPGPALLPENENEEEEDKIDDRGEDGGGEEEAPVYGGVVPVAIRWTSVFCILKDNSSRPVSCFSVLLILMRV
ncbi:hypothetical protein Droror1_Dr00022460 [Drosera rotundifolia]